MGDRPPKISADKRQKILFLQFFKILSNARPPRVKFLMSSLLMLRVPTEHAHGLFRRELRSSIILLFREADRGGAGGAHAPPKFWPAIHLLMFEHFFLSF